MKKFIFLLLCSLIWQLSISQTINLNIKAYIEGPFLQRTNELLSLMCLDICQQSQPYNTAPWNYPGTESVTTFPSSNIVDWDLYYKSNIFQRLTLLMLNKSNTIHSGNSFLTCFN